MNADWLRQQTDNTITAHGSPVTVGGKPFQAMIVPVKVRQQQWTPSDDEAEDPNRLEWVISALAMEAAAIPPPDEGALATYRDQTYRLLRPARPFEEMGATVEWHLFVFLQPPPNADEADAGTGLRPVFVPPPSTV